MRNSSLLTMLGATFLLAVVAQPVQAATPPVTPTLTTQATSATTGGFFSDTATLSGANSVTGTITFHLYGVGDTMCIQTFVLETVLTVSGDGTYSSDLFPAVAPGDYRWIVSYTDANNNSVTTACGDPTEISTVTLTTPTITTSATVSANTPGPISDTATLAGGFGPPTGTITFSLFGPGDTTCTTPIQSSAPPVNVTDNGSYGSGQFSAPVPGAYHWIAAYSGDSNNNPVATACSDETSTVTKTTPTIKTQAKTPVNMGDLIWDTATLSGGNSPVGTVDFRVFGPNDPTCTTPLAEYRPGVVNGIATSTIFLPTQPGPYRWIAIYSGDFNNNPAKTGCGDDGETSIVKAMPTISTLATGPTTAGGPISDTATLADAVAPTGSITFSLFGPNDATCAGPVLTSSTIPLSGNSSISAAFTPVSAGTYHWLAVYAGDANNNGATGLCTDPSEASVVTKAYPTISTQASGPTTLGGPISDTATLAGGSSPTGSISFSLFGDANCAGPVLTSSTIPLSGNSSTATAFTPVSAGTYHWLAVYAGDANNNGATGLCADPAEMSVVTSAISSQDVDLTMFNVGGFATGRLGAYIVIVSNTGTVPTSGTLTFTDTLPAGLSYAGSFAFGWTCSVAGQTVTCTFAQPLPVGGITAFAIFVNVTAAGGTTLTNTATVTPLDATPADNTAASTVTVRPSRRSNIDSESSRSNERDNGSQAGSSDGPSWGRD